MRVKVTIAVIAALLTVWSASDISAFDGERKGFVLGFGIGPAVTSFTQTLAYQCQEVTSDRENKFGLGTDFRIGYAPSNRLMIYYTNKVTWLSIENALNEDVIIVNGVGLLGVSYYFKPEKPSLYLTGTLGLSTWGDYQEIGDGWSGFGIGAGVGYELARYWSVEGNLIYGKPGDSEMGLDVHTNALGFMVTLNGTWY